MSALKFVLPTLGLAAARVQQASDLRTQIYAVLSAEQQAQIPGIVAANQAARAARIAAWRAQHTQF